MSFAWAGAYKDNTPGDHDNMDDMDMLLLRCYMGRRGGKGFLFSIFHEYSPPI